jgi:hypothetical protein
MGGLINSIGIWRNLTGSSLIPIGIDGISLVARCPLLVLDGMSLLASCPLLVFGGMSLLARYPLLVFGGMSLVNG